MLTCLSPFYAQWQRDLLTRQIREGSEYLLFSHLPWPCQPLQLHLCSLSSSQAGFLSIPKIYQVPSFLWVFKNPSPNSYLDISCSSFRFQLKCHFLNDVQIDALLCALHTLHFSFITLFTTCSFIFIFVTVCLMSIVISREKAPWGQRVCFAYHCLSRLNAELDSVFTK